MPRLADQLTTDFSAGMFDSVAPTAYPRAACAQILNGRLRPDGSVERRWGSRRTHAAATNVGTCYGATYFQLANGNDQLVAIFGTKAYSSDDYGVTWDEIATGLTSNYYDFATMRVGATNYLFLANGDTTVKRWDGSTWDTLPNVPSGVKYLAVFNSRLYVTGHSGIIVQASKVADPETWTTPDGLLLQILNHSGDVPTGLFQVGPHLLVFDRHATSYIDGFGEQTIIVAAGATGFSRTVGCVGFRTIQGVGDNGACWLSERGVEYYVPGGGIQLVSRPIQDFIENAVDWDTIIASPGLPDATYNPVTQDYLLAITTTGSRNNRVAVLNLRQANVDYQRSGIRAAASIDQPVARDIDEILFSSDADGYLTNGSTGVGMLADGDGYMTLGTVTDPGDPGQEDGDGYLVSIADTALPSALFVGPSTGKAVIVYSGGYDGFVRRHDDSDADDADADGTNGATFELTLLSKPFLLRRPRQRKRVRAAHLAVITDSNASVTLGVQGDGNSISRTLTISATELDQARRVKMRGVLKSDEPQVEVRSADRVRVSLVGVSAELMREPL